MKKQLFSMVVIVGMTLNLVAVGDIQTSRVADESKTVAEPARTFATAKLATMSYKQVPESDFPVALQGVKFSTQESLTDVKAFFGAKKSHTQASASIIPAVKNLLELVDECITNFVQSVVDTECTKTIGIDFKDPAESVVVELTFKKVGTDITVDVVVKGLAATEPVYVRNLLVAVLTADTLWQKHGVKISVVGTLVVGVGVATLWMSGAASRLMDSLVSETLSEAEQRAFSNFAGKLDTSTRCRSCLVSRRNMLLSEQVLGRADSVIIPGKILKGGFTDAELKALNSVCVRVIVVGDETADQIFLLEEEGHGAFEEKVDEKIRSYRLDKLSGEASFGFVTTSKKSDRTIVHAAYKRSNGSSISLSWPITPREPFLNAGGYALASCLYGFGVDHYQLEGDGEGMAGRLMQGHSPQSHDCLACATVKRLQGTWGISPRAQVVPAVSSRSHGFDESDVSGSDSEPESKGFPVSEFLGFGGSGMHGRSLLGASRPRRGDHSSVTFASESIESPQCLATSESILGFTAESFAKELGLPLFGDDKCCFGVARAHKHVTCGVVGAETLRHAGFSNLKTFFCLLQDEPVYRGQAPFTYNSLDGATRYSKYSSRVAILFGVSKEEAEVAGFKNFISISWNSKIGSDGSGVVVGSRDRACYPCTRRDLVDGVKGLLSNVYKEACYADAAE